MYKNVKKGMAVALSLAMGVQFGLSNSCYTNAYADETEQDEVSLLNEESTDQETEVSDSQEPVVEETTTEESQQEEETTQESSSSTKTVTEMSSDELFNYIMSISDDQLDALYDQYPNLDDLMTGFTESQKNQLAARFGNGGENAEETKSNDQVTETVKAYVYVNGYGYSDEALEVLGIDKSTVDNNGYFPVGEITVSSDFFNGKKKTSSSMINSSSDWSKLLTALSGMNTQTLVGKYASNKGNHIADYLSQATGDLNQWWGSGKTNFGYFNDYHYGFDDQNVNYHLDLHFNTSVINYVTGNNGISTGPAKDGTTVDTRTYINGSTAIAPRNLQIPDGYKLVGYYTDKAMTKPWIPGETKVGAGTTVYIKIAEQNAVTLRYEAVGHGSVSSDSESFNPVTGTPTGSKASAQDGYYFVGWYSDETCTNLVSSSEEFTPAAPTDGWKENDSFTYYAKFAEHKTVTVNYYWNGSDTKVADSSTYSDKKVGETFEFDVPSFDNYTPVTTEKQSITVDDDNSKNVINVYYYQNVKLIANSHEDIQYDGEEHTVSGYRVDQSDVSLTFDDLSASGKGTEVGTYSVTFNKDAKGLIDSSKKYIVDSTENGSFNIVKSSALTISIDAKDTSKVYDATPLKAEAKASITKGTTITYSTDEGKTWSEEVPSKTNVGTKTVIAKATNKNYVDATVEYTLEVTKRLVTFTGKSGTKVYNGENQTVEGYTTSGLVSGQTATLSASATRKDVGTTTGTITDADKIVIKSGEKDVTNNYSITTTPGSITITSQSIDPGTDPEKPDPAYKGVTVGTLDNVVYNGSEQKQEPIVKDKKENSLVKDVDYSLSYSEDTTNVGTVTVTVTGIGNYSGVVTRTYQITPKNYSITTDSASKTYDGNALTAGGNIEGIIAGETVDFQVKGSQTEVGSSDNTYSLNWTGTAKETNYTLASKSVGKLTVNESEKEITVTTTGGTFTYDGTAHGATVTVGELPTGYTLETATSSASATDVTKKDVVATCDTLVIKNASGKDVTDKLKIKKVNGTIKVTPAKLTVVTKSATKVYDGTPLTAGGTVTGFVEGETYGFVTTGKQTNVGSSVNGYTISFADQGVGKKYTAKNENYVVDESTLSVGTLTVTKQSIDPGTDPENPDPAYGGVEVGTLTDVKYNGTEQKQVPTVTDKDGKALTKGTDYTLSYSEDTKNVGTVTVTVTGIGNYSGSVQRTYQITPAKLTVVTESATKVYDGTPLTAGGKVTGFVEGETYGFVTTGKQTDVGTSDNGYTISFKDYGVGEQYTADQRNYVVDNSTLSVGKLTVTAQSINPKKDDGSDDPSYAGVKVGTLKDVVYNGTEQKQAPTVTNKEGTALVEGTDYELSYSEDTTNVGTVTVTVTGKNNYSGKVTRTYKITPVTLKVTTPSASKVYDGSALTAEGNVEGFVNDETATFTTTGTQTNVGSSENTYTLVFDGSAQSSNYKVSEEVGTLTVTKQSIDPGTDPDNPDPSYDGVEVGTLNDVVYNGKAQAQAPSVTDKTGKALDAANYSVSYSKDVTNAGTVTVTITGKGNYSGSVTRTYKITPASYSVTTESATKTYDGSALTANATISGIIDGEEVEIVATGSQTEVGSSQNTYKLTWKTAKESNYTLASETLGTLTITQAATPVVPSTPTTPTTPSTPVTPSTPARRVTPNNNVTPVTPSQQEETVEEDTTPKAKEKETEKVEKEKTPKAALKAYWALINLLAAILTVLFGLVLLLSKRHKDDEDEEDDSEEMNTEDENESEEAKKRGMISRVLAVVLGIGSVVFFLLTEDMRNLMTWTDKYTVWMVVLAVVQIVVFCVGRKWKDDSEEDEETE